MKTLIFLLLLATTASAEVLPLGSKLFYAQYLRGEGDELFVGDDELSIEDATMGGFEKFDINNTNLYSFFGVGHGGEIDLGLTYSQVDTGTNTFGGISELLARYRQQVYRDKNHDLILGLGLRTPGSDRSGDRFDSFNDGQTKFDYVLNYGYRIHRFILGLDARWTDRTREGSKSQSLYQLSATYSVTDAWYLRPFYQIFNTRDGRDISDADFGGRFSEVKENWNALGATVGYQLRSDLGIDLSYTKRLTSGAENTNAFSSWALGLSYKI